MCVRHFNQVIRHVSNSIDSEAESSVEAIRYFLDLADALLSLRNYNGSVKISFDILLKTPDFVPSVGECPWWITQ